MFDFLTLNMKSEWFWAAVSVGGAVFSFIWGNVTQRKIAIQQEMDNRMGEDLRLRAEIRQHFSKLASFHEDIDCIYGKEISEIKEDEIRLCIFQTIEILADAHYCSEMRGVENNLWTNTFEYIFRPQNRAFVSAFCKYSKQQHFSESFVRYVEKIISQNAKS